MATGKSKAKFEFPRLGKASRSRRDDARSRGQNQGQNWIRPEKRLAIYLRDLLCCVYCFRGVEDGTQLTLDHVIPHSKRGTNDTENLVTACMTCNASRGDRELVSWCYAVAEYLDHGLTVRDVYKSVADALERPIDVERAKKMIDDRGSAAKVLAKYRNR